MIIKKYHFVDNEFLLLNKLAREKKKSMHFVGIRFFWGFMIGIFYFKDNNERTN